MSAATLAARLPLPDGRTIPQVQLGVYMMSGREASRAVVAALTAGYRGVDSAQMYHNEAECGRAVRSFLADAARNPGGRLTREDIFFTSKLARNSDYAGARASVRRSVAAAGLGYIDLFLLHSPYGRREARLGSWRALEDAVRAGEVRSIGVSNFGRRHLEELLDSRPAIRPAVNQIEVHPFNTHADLTGFCAEQGIVVEAYAPLARAMRMTDPTLAAVASGYRATPAQVLVKWGIQHGFVTLPKSVREKRIVENASLDGLVLSDEDMRRLDAMDEELVTDWDPLDAP